MGYSKLTYEDYMDNLDYWWMELGVDLPKWADEVSEYGESVCAIDFYDDIFREGDLEPSRLPEDYRTGEYGAIALEISEKKKNRKGRRVTVTDGVKELIDLIEESENFCLIAPVSYAGRRRTNENARFLHALCVEIDNINPKHGISELFYTFRRDARPIPRPTYIVCSGNGLHLYWNFARPIPLFKNIFMQLTDIKTYITKNLWDKQISNSWQNIQYESLCQAFRCVGTSGKDKRKVAMAFKVGENLTIEEFNKRLPENLQMNVIYKSDLPLSKAKELYPKWYQKRIVEGKERGHWNRHEGIYHNWIEKIMTGAELGHRYNCLENLCSLAVQCQIPPEVVEADCRKVAEHMEELTEEEDNHFTEYDILCALRTYHLAEESAYHRRLEYIEQKTGIRLERNKRNGRKKEEHLKIARFTRDLTHENWRAGNGRKRKKEAVREWRSAHPNGTKAECREDTGMSWDTIRKWWNDVELTEEQKKLGAEIRTNPEGEKEVYYPVDEGDGDMAWYPASYMGYLNSKD